VGEIDRTLFPDDAQLLAGLTAVLRDGGHTRGPITVRERRLDPHAATFPNEVVVCALEDGRVLKLFCKYGATHRQTTYGHKEGVAYEGTVYRDVLTPLATSTPRCYGTWAGAANGHAWLVLDYLEESAWFAMSGDSSAMARAADWAGRFHARAEALVARSRPDLNVYDRAYYLGWASRTWEFAEPLRPMFPWLETLCARFADTLPLLSAPPTVIHGEYYKKNVLISGETIVPVDWESAAIAVGEIDLAALIEGWEDEPLIRGAIAAYRDARWPDGAPADFARRLTAAQLYSHFRWLGERASWTTREGSRWRFDSARALGEKLGLL
jgi:phosphotransferase family enzyme